MYASAITATLGGELGAEGGETSWHVPGHNPLLVRRVDSWLVLIQIMCINIVVSSKSLYTWLPIAPHWTEFQALLLCARQRQQCTSTQPWGSWRLWLCSQLTGGWKDSWLSPLSLMSICQIKMGGNIACIIQSGLYNFQDSLL